MGKLAAKLAALRPSARQTWATRLRASDPSKLDEVNALVLEWINGRYRDKLPTRHNLVTFLLKEGGLPVSVCRLTIYVKGIEDGEKPV